MRLLLATILSLVLVSSGLAQDATHVIVRAQQEFHLDHDNHNQVTVSKAQYTTQHGYTMRTRPILVSQPRHPEQIQEARRSYMTDFTPAIERVVRLVTSPDVEDQHTLSQLARMSGNAYALPGQKNWYDMDFAWNNSFPYGWEDPADGFRGHVFRSSDNSTVVLSIKGTTLNGPTSRKDKFNDNLLFSCCCGRVAFGWRTVCGCYAGRNRCDAICLSDAMIEESLFYSVGVSLVTQLLVMYPDADIWLVGHSLGGSLASLLGATFGLPAVAFEAPGEKSAAHHLHLPVPRELIDNAPVTHVYHNADPIPMGTCNGALSVCAQAGYALETKCHLGKSIVYDTVGELGWTSDVRHHPIRQVITKVIEADRLWGEKHRVPPAQSESDCHDCTKWEYDDFGK